MNAITILDRPSISELRKQNMSHFKDFRYTHLIRLSQTIEPFFTYRMPLWKRTLDLIGSATGLIILAPLFLLIALVIKRVSPGPVFFKQERIGYGGQIFTFFKFRTMKVNADVSSHKQYLAELISDESCGDSGKPMTKLDEVDSQIIPFGRFLRNTSLDELPQLFNVLRGEMSLVGPRPPIPYEADQYLQWHNGRFEIIPGMTGLWQVSGKNRLSFKEMVRLDIRYSRNSSLLQDLTILLKTPVAIVAEYLYSRQKEKEKGADKDD